MMWPVERLAIAAALVALAALVAWLLGRRRPAPPTQPRWPVPTQLDRADFVHPERPWLLVVFTSATCDSCAQATAKAAVLENRDVAYQEVPWQEHRDLHDRYGIEAVPTIVVADEEGVARASFVGVPNTEALWATVNATRDDGNASPSMSGVARPEDDLGPPGGPRPHPRS